MQTDSKSWRESADKFQKMKVDVRGTRGSLL
jgi:hypothetical protein